MSRKSILFFCLVVGFGCVEKRESGTPPQRSKWLRWSLSETPALTTPQILACNSRACFRHAFLILEGLTRVAVRENSQVAAPALAESWHSPNPLELVFHLRPGLAWSSGEPLQASQFIDAWKRLLTRCADHPAAERLFIVRGAKAFCERKVDFGQVGFQAVDSSTLKIHLRQPTPFAAKAFGHPALWPWREGGAEVNSGLGAFIPEKNKPGASEFRYRRNPARLTMSAAPSGPDGIEVSIEKQAGVRVQLFQEGQLDLVDDIPASTLPSLPPDPRLKIFPSPHRISLLFNPTKKPFQSRAARKAFAQSIQREEWIKLMRVPFLEAATLSGLPETGVSPFGVRFEESAPRGWAAQGIEAAAIHLTLAWSAKNDLLKEVGSEIAQNFQAQWLRRLGVRVDVSNAAPTASSPPTLQLVTTREDPLDELAVLESFSSHWNNRAFELLLSRASQSEEFGAMSAAANQAQKILVEDEAIVWPLYIQGRAILLNPKWTLPPPGPFGNWDFPRAELAAD